MSLTLAEVEHIAELARLELTEEEKERYREQLSRHPRLRRPPATIDTSHIPPTSSVLREPQRCCARMSPLPGLQPRQALQTTLRPRRSSSAYHLCWSNFMTELTESDRSQEALTPYKRAMSPAAS